MEGRMEEGDREGSKGRVRQERGRRKNEEGRGKHTR